MPEGAPVGGDAGASVNDVPMGGVGAAMPLPEGAPGVGEGVEAENGVALTGAGSTPAPAGEEVSGPPSFEPGQPGTAGGKPGVLPADKAVGPAPPGAGTTPPVGKAEGAAPADGAKGTPPKPLPPEGSGQKARPEVTFSDSGSLITVSGTITPATASDGKLRLDVLKPGSAGFPELIHSEELKRGGPFLLRVPASSGEIRVIAYFDIGEPGPQDGEDAGRANLTIGTTDIPNVALKIEKVTKKD